MHFDLVDLRLFIAVAEARSITHGATRVHLALASASERIKGLEAALGIALLERGRRGVTPTAAGESLLDHARLVLRQVEVMRGDLLGFARGLHARVKILANTSGLSEHLPKAVASFLAEHPTISIEVEERESVDIAQLIASGAADIGVAVEDMLPATVKRYPFCDDNLVLVVPRTDALARHRRVAFADVLGRAFVGLSGTSALHDHVVRQAVQLGARLRFRVRMRSFDAVCELVAAGAGIAVIPEAAARRCSRGMAIQPIRLRERWAQRKLVVCTHDGGTMSKPAQQLFEHLRRAAR
ncbi:LysR substrate-binding domain-containing protein [Bradyrhizobium sp. LHD-71]|uniref:LysR substrate-binding domain-containing protein n=1 Tax=Bradyrhizobium sp. LHD-71 TaxID=3072141 RepID=UPI00280CA931|nr:LysR substrate-binding domain-containing protein [Bradyrhizobium sp. LHD-71]MDQ8726853.1 LysR substrate-binding domain-containing protein [Bradyrhizobium sp. LHD-71]